MPGFDTRGGKPANYTLGRGKLYLTGDGAKTASLGNASDVANSQKVWRDVGNVTAFTIAQESETKEHKSSLQGLQVIDLEVAVSQKMTISFTLDELNANNLSRFLSGKYIGLDNDTGSSGLANGAAIASDDALIASGSRNYFIDTDATDRVHDVWYDIVLSLPIIGVTNAPCIDFESQANQAITVRKQDTTNIAADGTALTEGTHYELDRRMGRIRFLAVAGGLTAGDTFTVEWNAPSVAKSATPGLDDSLWVIQPLTTSSVSVGLMFILENANDGDHPTGYEFWQVKLKPDGELAGIGDDWATLNFTGVVESVAQGVGNRDVPYGSEYGRAIGRNSFST